MMVENTWLGAAMCVGAAVSPGIGELKADQQSVVGSSGGSMLFDQSGTQLCKTLLGVRSRQKLIRVGTSFVGNCYRLTPPDQLRAAAAEALPAPDCVRARIAI